MLRAAATILILLTPTTSFALAMCQLSPERCKLVRREMERLDIQEMHDYDNLTGLRPYQRRQAVIERSVERLRQRISMLPRDVADELARLRVCDSKDRLAGAQGTFNNDPNCR